MPSQVISISISFTLGLILSYVATKAMMYKKVPKLKTNGSNVFKTFNKMLMIYLFIFNLFLISITTLLLIIMKSSMQPYLYLVITVLLSSFVYIYFNIIHKVFITKLFINDSSVHDVIYHKNIIDIHALVVACFTVFSFIVCLSRGCVTI